MASLSSYPTPSRSSSSPQVWTSTTQTVTGRVPAASSLKARSHTNEKTALTAGQALPSSRVCTSLRQQYHHHAPRNSPLAPGLKSIKSVKRETVKSPLSLDKDSLPATLSSSSSSSSSPVVADPREGKDEVTLPPISCQRLKSLEEMRIKKTSKKSVSQVAVPSSPPLSPSLKPKKEEVRPIKKSLRSTLALVANLEIKANTLVNNNDFEGAAALLKELKAIASTLKVSCLFADRLTVRMMIKQFKQNLITSDNLKTSIQFFLEKYPVATYPSERKFVIGLLKWLIEFNCNDYGKTQLESFLLELERNLRKLQELSIELGVSIEENSFIQTYQGILFNFQSNPESAFTCLQKALRLSPDDPLIVTQLGLVCISLANKVDEQGGDQLTQYQVKMNKKVRYMKAIEYFTQALDMNENNLLALKGCAFVYYKLEKIGLAFRSASLAKDCDPKDPEANHLYDMIDQCRLEARYPK